jgi:hypothetical protein
MGIVFDEVVGSVAEPAPTTQPGQPASGAAASGEREPDLSRLRRELAVLRERAARLAAD